jgi:hypothetical protein
MEQQTVEILINTKRLVLSTTNFCDTNLFQSTFCFVLVNLESIVSQRQSITSVQVCDLPAERHSRPEGEHLQYRRDIWQYQLQLYHVHTDISQRFSGWDL